jgi:hypothetical protein
MANIGVPEILEVVGHADAESLTFTLTTDGPLSNTVDSVLIVEVLDARNEHIWTGKVSCPARGAGSATIAGDTVDGFRVQSPAHDVVELDFPRRDGDLPSANEFVRVTTIVDGAQLGMTALGRVYGGDAAPSR